MENLNQNKTNAISFYRMSYDGNPRNAAFHTHQIWPGNEEYVTKFIKQIQIIAVLLGMITNRPSAVKIVNELSLDRSQIQVIQILYS
jgi:hypothetical protein